MEIKVTKKHKVTFAIEYFEGQEGGVVCDTFRSGIGTIEEAIAALEMAEVNRAGHNWIITAEVTTSISAG